MMKTSWMCTICTVVILLGMAQRGLAQQRPWVSAYVAGWSIGNGGNGYLPVQAIDFTAVTHVIHFALVPNADGSLNAVSNSITDAGSQALISAAHSAGAKVLVSIGGWQSEGGFLGATNSATITAFIHNITDFVHKRGYDGVDIDWEPLSSGDAGNFSKLAASLRSALPSSVLTTTCIPGNEQLMASVQSSFDQINIMTYDMSFASQGWVVWFNSPIYNGAGLKFPGLNVLLPSIDSDVKSFEAAGVAASKLGIGSEFGGAVWRGVVAPGDLLTSLAGISYDVPLYTSDGSGIMQKYYSASLYHWDSNAEAGYLSIPGLIGGIGGTFISFEDSNAIVARADYVKKENLGGMIIYELGMGYPGNGTYPLLAVTKQAFLSGVSTTPPTPPSPPSQPPSPPGGQPTDVGPSTMPGLDQNYPNPFNTGTTIKIRLPVQSHVSVIIYNALGEVVAHIADEEMPAGTFPFIFDGTNLPSGTYFCMAEVYNPQSGLVELQSKMVLVK